MAEDVIDAAAATGALPAPARGCVTRGLRLLGARRFSAGATPADVAQRAADIAAAPPLGAAPPGPRYAVSSEAARHLAAAYGDRAHDVLELVRWSDGALAAPLAPGLPYIEAEVIWAVRHEYCATVEDFIARRTRMAFLDARAAEVAAPRVADLMARELGWGSRRRRQEAAAAVRALRAEFSTPPPAAAAAKEEDKAAAAVAAGGAAAAAQTA